MGTYVFAGLHFDPADGALASADGAGRTQLRPQVARLLLAFVERPQTLIDRESLCRAVWDEGTVVDFESGLAAVLRELRAEIKSLGGADELIETVPRRGYRLRVPVQRPDAPSPPRPGRRQRLFGLSAALVGLLALIVLVLVVSLPADRTADRVAEGAPSPGWTLAVLPFSQFGEVAPGARRFDLLLADRLLVHLWDQRPADLNLIGRASLAPYAGSDDLAAAVARDLGVNLLIEGSVVLEGEAMTVAARLLEMPGGRILWSETLDYPIDAAPTADAIAAALARSLLSDWSARTP